MKDASTLFEFDINFKADKLTVVFNKNTQLFEKNSEYISLIERINEREEKNKDAEGLKRVVFDRYPVVDEKEVFDWKLSEICCLCYWL